MTPLKLYPCEWCLSSSGELRDYGGCRVVLCKGCATHVLRIANQKTVQA